MSSAKRMGAKRFSVDEVLDWIVRGEDYFTEGQARDPTVGKEFATPAGKKELLKNFHLIIKSMGFESYDPLVLGQLSKIMQNYVGSLFSHALRLYQHRSPDNTVNVEEKDLQAALRSWDAKHAFFQMPAALLATHATRINKAAIPPIANPFGLQVPGKSNHLGENYVLTVQEDASEAEEEAPSRIAQSNSAAAASGSGENVSSIRVKRKRETLPPGRKDQTLSQNIEAGRAALNDASEVQSPEKKKLKVKFKLPINTGS